MALSAALKFGLLPQAAQRAWLAEQPRDRLDQMVRGDWWWIGRPEQFAPAGNWLVWLILSGRGWGKTRTGAEWLVNQIMRHPLDALGHRTEWLVIAETLNDARTVCIEGNGGIISVLARLGLVQGRDFKYEKSPRLMIRFNTGQLIYFLGADDPDVGRGFNAAGCWIDEMAKFRYTWNAWFEGILPSLRAPLIDDHPRTVVTTTPKPIKLLLHWNHTTDGTIKVTRGSTFDNRANLSPYVLAELERIYAGTSVGRQELHGVLLEEIEGALWKHSQIEADRVKRAPELVDVLVAMDPASTGTEDECGLIALGRGEDDHDYVLEDWSGPVSGHAAAIKAWELVNHVGASRLVVEDNVAKLWLVTVLRDAYLEMRKSGIFPPGGEPPIKPVTARHGKRLRAEPIASRYEQHRVHHVGAFPELEDQQCLAAGTLIETDRGQVPIEQVTSADRVMTRGGFAPLAWAGKTGTARDLVAVLHADGGVVSTPWHPFYLPNTGRFVNAHNVQPSDHLLVSPNWDNTGRLSPGGAAGTTECPTATIDTPVDNYSTGSPGKPITDQSPPDYSSITTTTARGTTDSKTLSWSVPHNTSSTTLAQAGTLGPLSNAPKSPAGSGPTTPASSSPAPSAVASSGPATCGRSAVVQIVTAHGGDEVPVYNLTVAPGHLPEFFANGILVHNCTWVPSISTDSPDRVDALVYAGLHVVGKERRIATVAVPSAQRTLAGISSPY